MRHVMKACVNLRDNYDKLLAQDSCDDASVRVCTVDRSVSSDVMRETAGQL